MNLAHTGLASSPPALHRAEAPTVFIVDADARVRELLASLSLSAGWRPSTAGSAEEFLSAPRAYGPHCLITDVQLPGASGLELQSLVKRAATPVIFLSSCTDVRSGVLAMKAGAIEYMVKPYVRDVLLQCLHDAIELSRTALRIDSEFRALKHLHESLTPRERQVMQLVVLGLLNKEVARELGITEITVKVHRGQVMRKMKATSLLSLVTMADRLGLRPTSH